MHYRPNTNEDLELSFSFDCVTSCLVLFLFFTYGGWQMSENFIKQFYSTLNILKFINDLDSITHK